MAAPMEHLTAVWRELETWEIGCTDGVEPDVDRVRRVTELFKEAKHRENADEKIFTLLLKILSRTLGEIQAKSATSDSSPECWLDLSTECFRCLRNSCVQCTRNQNTIRNVGLIEETVSLIKVLSSSSNCSESFLVAFRCGLQFLGNVAGGNQGSQNRIWNHAFPQLFLSCLTHEDEKVATYGSMVLFTCMGEDKMADLMVSANLSVAVNVITAYNKWPNAEWLQLIVTDRFLRYPELLKQIYASLSHSDRVVLLELIMTKVSDKSLLGVEELASLQKIAEFLSGCFQSQCRAVLKLAGPTHCDEQEAVVVVRLLDVLCEMTSDSEHLTCLQSCPGLLDTVVETLRMTHLVGKQSTNIFTSTHTASLGSDLTHAAVGFKAHLVRLIANLCYRNKDNQDKIYELDGIPLILDNCSIDDNNPFLNQWAFYAIRNLTEHNERNQGLIANLERQGPADASALANMGLEVEERDGKLVLRSIKKM
ncbi:ataxin-10 isoform X1 [Rana temporaria]|uniref:ataxin-10 isoform X1 n=2 Tax=Rana temporaria TaxID=8407 RepID=UPI001AADBDDC|nr:ataxin-10 isoform X1 [Rana temporaria]